MQTTYRFLFSGLLSLLAPLPAADIDRPIRVETRMLLIDTIVREPATSEAIAGLSAANFELRVDGKARPITHFQAHGGERRPLALIIHFNLAAEGALRHMQPGTLESFRAALNRLAATDEVAVTVAEDWFVGKPELIAPLSRDRARAAEALTEAVRRALGQSAATKSRRRAEPGQSPKPAGRSMSEAVEFAAQVAGQRPDSQVALVYVSDGMNTLDTMENRHREALAETLLEHNISVSALNLDMLGGYAAAATVINPLGKLFGISVTGSASYLAKQTGGVSVDVGAPENLGVALDKVVSAYASRYTLGISLEEREYRDARWHKVDVKLKKLGDGRKAVVSARRAFFGRRDDAPVPPLTDEAVPPAASGSGQPD